MKVMRPTWNMQQSRGSTFLRNNSFSHTWRSNIKAETRGTYTGKLSQQFYNSISYFSTLLCILLFWLPNFAFGYSQRQSRRVWEKQIYKNRSEYYHCLYFYRKPAFCIGHQVQETKYLRTTHQYHQQYIHGENHICKEWRPWKKQIHVLLKWWKQSVTLWGYCDNINR